MPSKPAYACLALCLAAAAAVLSPLSPLRLVPLDRRAAHTGAWHSEGAEAHRVHLLPGWGKLDCRLYSGEVPIGKGRALFYALVESECRRPEDAPVVLWLTG